MGYQRSDNRYGEDRWRDRDDRGRDYGRSQERGDYGRGGDDRGFFERAGDEVRSWFGDDEAERRREMDERRWERERGMTGSRDNGWERAQGDRTAGGWGNQQGESWHRDRPGVSGGYGAFGAGSAPGTVGGDRFQGSASSPGGNSDNSRRFGVHDPHYSQWRDRQIDEFDRDYEDYRREHQSRFEQEFGTWRSKRQGQRQSLARVSEHMEVTGSDGQHIGAVDKVRGDRILLTRSDEASGGRHHSVPCSWIETVEDKVVLNRSADDARQAWRDEERGAFFDRGGDRDESGRMLNRSFAGTYQERSEGRPERRED
jgi:hypothetical protein